MQHNNKQNIYQSNSQQFETIAAVYQVLIVNNLIIM